MDKKIKRDYLLEKVCGILISRPKGALLDLGCGNGHFSKRLADTGFNVVSADMDKGKFEYHESIEFKECQLDNPLPFPDNTFDYLLFLEVIEHLENPYFVVGEIGRVLKPGGNLILSTPKDLTPLTVPD